MSNPAPHPSRIGTVLTRIVCISDTHKTPLHQQGDIHHAFRDPLPDADVLIHAGDLTENGGWRDHQITFDVLASSSAEIKLVIAGNHDRDLDRDHWTQRYREVKGFCSDAQSEAALENAHSQVDQMRQFWLGNNATKHGIHFLDEGTHTFTLRNGAVLTVYASPYTPEFGDWAFAYKRSEDRFNPPTPQDSAQCFVPPHPAPDFPNVDIMLTHGPPSGVLDMCFHGERVGCAALWKAVQRVRPRMHVFGHIHEEFGAERIEWVRTGGEKGYGPKSRMKLDMPDMEIVRRRGWVYANLAGTMGGTVQQDIDVHEDSIMQSIPQQLEKHTLDRRSSAA